MAPSTIAPMAMAMPPKDMMLALMPCSRIRAKAARMATGRLSTTTSDERRWNRKSAHTRATTASSSTRVVPRVATARSISAERSYTGTISTPAGRPCLRPSRRSFTRSMVARALAPLRITTMPPTTSPSPSSSATPRRMAGPTRSSATSPSNVGTPSWSAPKGMAARSSRPRR